MRTLVILFCLVAAAGAQNLQRTLHLENVPDARGYQEMATVLRTVADIPEVSIDAPSRSIAIGGGAARIAMAEWLVHLLDQPVNPGADESHIRANAMYRYATPGTVDDVARLFYLQNTDSPQRLQELLTNLRTVADVQKIFNYTPLTAIALRGPAAQMDLAEWMTKQLDVAGQPQNNPAVFPYKSPEGKEEVVRVFYLPRITDAKDLNALLTSVRLKIRIQKAFYCSRPAALMLRGTPDQMAAAEKLINESDAARR